MSSVGSTNTNAAGGFNAGNNDPSNNASIGNPHLGAPVGLSTDETTAASVPSVGNPEFAGALSPTTFASPFDHVNMQPLGELSPKVVSNVQNLGVATPLSTPAAETAVPKDPFAKPVSPFAPPEPKKPEVATEPKFDDVYADTFNKGLPVANIGSTTVRVGKTAQNPADTGGFARIGTDQIGLKVSGDPNALAQTGRAPVSIGTDGKLGEATNYNFQVNNIGVPGNPGFSFKLDFKF